MAIKDIKSNLTTFYTDLLTIAPSTNVQSVGVEVNRYNNGVMLVILPTQSDDVANTVTLDAIQESTDDVSYNDIDDDLYIGSLSQFADLELFTPPIIVPTLGVFGSQKFLRANITTGANTGNMTLVLVWILKSEVRPDPNDPNVGPISTNNLIDGLGNNVLDGLSNQITVGS